MQQENSTEDTQNILHNTPVPYYNPSVLEAVIVAISVVAILSSLMIVAQWMPHLAIMATMTLLIIYGILRKVPFIKMQTAMGKTLLSGVGAIYLLFFIGILVTSLMMSGAIPSLIYYGTFIISAKYFYVSVFLLTSIIGVSIGSSLTSTATIGVAFMGIALAFDANLVITAGAIVSGAFFSDKMSPLSDTTTIAASVVNIDLFEHIKNMSKTTIPAFLIALVFYITFSFIQTNNFDFTRIAKYQQGLLATGLIYPMALTPLLLLIILAIKRVPAVVSIIFTAIFSIFLAQFVLDYDFATLGKFFYSGFVAPQIDGMDKDIASILSRGGISSMFFTITIVILAISMGGLLFVMGIIPTLLNAIASWLKTTARATFSVALTSVGVNILIGEQYLSVILAGQTFAPVYDRLSLHRKNLSRTLEDAGTVINPLVPWSVCGVFIADALQVPVLSYLPFAIFCYASLILTLISGYRGKTITKLEN